MFSPRTHSCKIERFHLRDSLSRADLGVGRGGPGTPFCGLLNISALHVQYRIQVFAKFKRPECTTLHLRELQSQKCSRLQKCAVSVRSPIALKHKFFSIQITTVRTLVSERDQFFALQF